MFGPVHRSEGLEKFLQEQTGVDQEAVLAYLSDGQRLGNENVRELAGAHDQVSMACMIEGYYLLIRYRPDYLYL